MLTKSKDDIRFELMEYFFSFYFIFGFIYIFSSYFSQKERMRGVERKIRRAAVK